MNLETFYPLERPAGEMVRLTLADDAHVAALLAVGDPAAEVRLWRWSNPALGDGSRRPSRCARRLKEIRDRMQHLLKS